jgi:hypothetical protein
LQNTLGYNYIMTTLIYTSFKKRKQSKPTAKQRQVQAEWDALLKKYEPKKPIAQTKGDGWKYSLGETAHREMPKIPSLPFTGGVCAKKENPVYTGNAIKGIGTMHKSNSVPIFTDEQAIEIATMRRN